MIRRTPSIQNEHVIISFRISSDIEPHFWFIVWLPAKSSMSFPNVSLTVVSDTFTSIPWKQGAFLYWSSAYELTRSIPNIWIFETIMIHFIKIIILSLQLPEGKCFYASKIVSFLVIIMFRYNRTFLVSQIIISFLLYLSCTNFRCKTSVNDD